MKIKKITIIILLLFSTLLPLGAKAEDGAELPTVDEGSPEITALTITPSVYEGVLTRGQATSAIFELKNNSRVPLPIKCYIRNFEASD